MDYKWLYKIKYSDRENYEQEYKNRSKSLSSYRYDFNVHGYPAFVLVTPELMQLVYDIKTHDKELYKKQKQLPSVALESYMRSCLIDEVKQTNELEGVASTRKEINDILIRKNKTNTRLMGIVNKYALLLNNNDVPLSSCSDIRKLYDDLVLDEIKQSDSTSIPDGEIFRKERVYVKDNNTGKVIHTGSYPESEIIESINSVINIINNQSYNSLINIAVIHYMFGYIHPFYDGNGRTSRFISSYLLSKELERIISFRLSYAIKKDTSGYYKIFKLTNDEVNRGELTGFVIYFMDLLRATLITLNSKLSDYINLLRYYGKILDKLNYDDLSLEILFILIQNTLFSEYGLSIQDICNISEKGDTTVRKSIKTMCDDGLLECDRSRPYKYKAQISKIDEYANTL